MPQSLPRLRGIFFAAGNADKTRRPNPTVRKFSNFCKKRCRPVEKCECIW